MRQVRGFLIIGLLFAAACQTSESAPGVATAELRGGNDCDLVRCPMPLCIEGQHLAYQGSCCPTCVGRPSKCANVLCLAVECPEGEQRVYTEGNCCGICRPIHAVAECNSADDCPQFYCIACPCPYSECQGHKCVTRTPSSDTCGGEL